MLPAHAVAVDHGQEVLRVGDGEGQEGGQLALPDLPGRRSQELAHAAQPALRQRDEVDGVGYSARRRQGLNHRDQQKRQGGVKGLKAVKCSP